MERAGQALMAGRVGDLESGTALIPGVVCDLSQRPLAAQVRKQRWLVGLDKAEVGGQGVREVRELGRGQFRGSPETSERNQGKEGCPKKKKVQNRGLWRKWDNKGHGKIGS